MTRRDLKWKAGGFTLMVFCCAICVTLDGSPLTLLFFPLAFLGMPLMIYGRRVGQMLRAERHGHSRTAEAVHAARVCHRRQGPDGFGL